ncbi:MAG: DNA primase, partial [Planctomycetes bacterium]|nr:DNA primase [Planctomycetota bacterium]
KLQKWEKAGRPGGKQPIKHKFVKGFHKGQLLYGLSNRRLTPALWETLAKFGLIIVEGMNDVMRLACFPLGAEGLCMNRATDEQIALIVEDAKRHAGGRIWLMPDNDKEGLTGFQELLWKLQQHEGIDARPGWPQELSHVPEPEELTDEELAEILAPFLLRG